MPLSKIKVPLQVGEAELVDLGADMNSALGKLLGQLAATGQADWVAFEPVAQALFDATPGQWDVHDAYFSNLGAAWHGFLDRDSFRKALAIWACALAPVYRWEDANPGKRIHKASAYYFAGGTTLLAGDLDTAFLLMHQALDEDEQTAGSVTPNLPAWKFVSLDGDSTDHLFQPLVHEVAAFADARLAEYRALGGSSLTLSDVRSRLLQNVALKDIVFHFVHALFKVSRLARVDFRTKQSRFAPLLEANAILSLYMTLEELLRVKHGPGMMHGLVISASVALSLHIHEAEPSIGKPRLEVLKDAFATNASGTLTQLLDGTYTGTNLTPIEACLAAAPSMRNTFAHRIESQPLIAARFDEIVQFALNAIFFVLDACYP